MRWLFTRRRVLSIIAALALAFVAFEVGVRLLPPDAVSYETQSSVNGGPVTVTSGTINDPSTVRRWYVAMMARPTGRSLLDLDIAHWQGRDTCAPLGYYAGAYRFTWHGLPVEVVSPGPTCAGDYQISSGGIPDWNTYVIDPLPQP